MFWAIYQKLLNSSPCIEYIVLEVADGIFQRETSLLLSDKKIQSRVNAWVFSCCDSLSAVGGLRILRDQYGIFPVALSGPVANSPLSIQEVIKNEPSTQFFNNMKVDPEKIFKIFQTSYTPIE